MQETYFSRSRIGGNKIEVNSLARRLAATAAEIQHRIDIRNQRVSTQYPPNTFN